jgi:hypothetical protein
MRKASIFLGAAGRIFFRNAPPRTGGFWPDSRPTTHKEEKMADAKVLHPMNPEDIVKLLVALRRALKARVA